MIFSSNMITIIDIYIEFIELMTTKKLSVVGQCVSHLKNYNLDSLMETIINI